MMPGKSNPWGVRNVRNVTLLSCTLYTLHSAITSFGGYLAGQSHLIHPIQNAQKILVVPARFEALGMDTNMRRVFLTQEI
jgi:hypothetical protein